MKSVLVSVSLMMGLASPVWAHDGHSHEASAQKAPHGGNLRDAGDIVAEVVVKGDVVTLYVYDKHMKPVKPEKDALSGDVQFPKEKSKPLTLKKKGDVYEATIKGISKVHRYDMHINVEHAGKKTLVDFGLDNI